MNYKKGYKNKKFLRFIYGRKFNIIYNYLKNNEENNIYSFLRFITNNELENLNIQYKWNNNNYKDEFQNIIDNCNDFIDKVLNYNNLPLKKIYEKTMIKNSSNLKMEIYKGFYLFPCSKVEKEIIQLYQFLTENIPIAQNILLCNENTSNEEITAFLYRAVLCEFNSCFIIGGIESLKMSQQTYFIENLIQILYETEGIIESCLIIFIKEKNSDIYKNIDLIKYKKTFNPTIKTNLDKIKIDKFNRIKIITSDEAGIGKSTKIKNIIKKSRKIYIYFPLGGVFTRNDIFQRLKNLKITKNTAIHLDLYDTNCIDLMMEFLFWILIGNLYIANEEIIYLSKDTEIYIEIPNRFINFLKKISILELIPQKPENKLSISNLEPLIVSRDINSKIQIICNFLKVFKEKKIDDYNLNIPGFTLDLIKEDNSQIIDAKVLPQNECQELLFEVIKENNKFINYYQIQSFIDFLAYEFIKFNNNIHFSAISLVEKHLRSFIIDGLIKLSNYFIEASFNKLIIEQNTAYNKQYTQYDEKDDNIKGINYLGIDKYFLGPFDKFEQPLFFFHGGSNQTFSYITKKSQDPQECEKLISLLNSQYKNNFKSFCECDNEKFYFLQEIKLFLDINNPLRKVDKNPYDIIREKKSLEEISNYYAFSSYNYNKMILILLRLRANIPIIMMGETGCGKTALIKQLYELQNNGNVNTMKIFKINEGTTDNDIINFIERILPEAEILEEIENKNKSQRDKQKILYEKKKYGYF